jgi:hypothetical protein
MHGKEAHKCCKTAKRYYDSTEAVHATEHHYSFDHFSCHFPK